MLPSSSYENLRTMTAPPSLVDSVAAASQNTQDLSQAAPMTPGTAGKAMAIRDLQAALSAAANLFSLAGIPSTGTVDTATIDLFTEIVRRGDTRSQLVLGWLHDPRFSDSATLKTALESETARALNTVNEVIRMAGSSPPVPTTTPTPTPPLAQPKFWTWKKMAIAGGLGAILIGFGVWWFGFRKKPSVNMGTFDAE